MCVISESICTDWFFLYFFECLVLWLLFYDWILHCEFYMWYARVFSFLLVFLEFILEIVKLLQNKLILSRCGLYPSQAIPFSGLLPTVHDEGSKGDLFTADFWYLLCSCLCALQLQGILASLNSVLVFQLRTTCRLSLGPLSLCYILETSLGSRMSKL